jgi:hypothetical protein
MNLQITWEIGTPLTGFREVEIHVDSFVTLNGRRSERLIKPNTNIYKVGKSTFYKKCIIPYKYEIRKI